MIQKSGMNAQGAQKLKDTCDICSASKVKCDKQRPICGRCDKLGYPCFYSLARRKGRPNPPRNRDSLRNSVELGERLSEEQRDVADGGGTVPSQTGMPKSVGPHHDAGAIARGPHNTNYQQDQNHPLHFQQGILARTNHSHLSSHSNAETCPSINRIDSMDTFFPRTDATTCNLSTNNASSTIDAWSTMSSNSDHGSNAECSDCVTVAMNVLQHLTATSIQTLPLSHSTSTCALSSQHHMEFNGPLELNTWLTTASTAIKRLSTILICPCSCKTDVGILNAALCGAILDLYDTILRSTIDPPKSQSSSTDVADDMDLYAAESSLCGGANESRQITIRRVLEELPKVANLIMQLTRRYCSAFGAGLGTAGLGLEDEENEERAADLLLAELAASQQSRLRSIIHEATNWLALV